MYLRVKSLENPNVSGPLETGSWKENKSIWIMITKVNYKNLQFFTCDQKLWKMRFPIYGSLVKNMFYCPKN